MGLLDILAEKMNCTYLSDLRFLPRPNEELRQAVAIIPVNDFFEYEWIYAADYLCGVKCESMKDARYTLLRHI